MTRKKTSTQSSAKSAGMRSKAPAITRASAVLKLLAKCGNPLPLQVIARDTGLVPSTCLYVLRALVDEELVAFDSDTKRYTLGAGVLVLAQRWLEQDDFASVAQPQLDQVSGEFGVTSLGVQIFGLDHIIVVASSAAGNNFQISARVGSRFPALISATGRCIAAWADCSDSELRARFKRLRWDDPPDFGEWLQQVEATRERGFAVDEGHYMRGVTVLASPVWSVPGQPSHAIVALGIGSALKPSDTRRLGKKLDAQARALNVHFGCGRD
jgi:DNA-binding IclR family transcriptional regulator